MPLSLIWIITTVLLLAGLAGTIIPGLPGIGLVFGGILLYGILTDFTTISIPAVAAFGGIALLAVAADYAGSFLGAKVGGGKKIALLGTIGGAIIGAFTGGPLGILIGAFVGGLVGALIEGQTHHQAFKIAALSVVGILGAAVFQFVLAAAMIVAFVITVLV